MCQHPFHEVRGYSVSGILSESRIFTDYTDFADFSLAHQDHLDTLKRLLHANVSNTLTSQRTPI